MDPRTLDALDLLGKALLVMAVLVLALSIVGAIAISSSSTTALSGLGFDELERQGRGVAALLELGAGFAAAGVLAGLGGILRVLVAGQRD